MRALTQDLPSDAPGRVHRLGALGFGAPGARPKAYLQAGLHADEMPGPLILHHLSRLLAAAEAEGRLIGEVILVPLANPIGFGQWVQNKPQGRQDLNSMLNFNRDFPDLAELCGDDLAGRLGPDPAHNREIILTAFAAALHDLPAPDEGTALRRALMLSSYDADHVLDLHCDHHAILHLYTSPAHPTQTRLLAQSMGAELVLLAEVSGGNAFDEAHSAPWHLLAQRFGVAKPVPPGPFAATLEYRGQFDVSDAQAASDAANLLTYLAGEGVIHGPCEPAHPAPPEYPLAGAAEITASQGGIVTWTVPPGTPVTRGQTIGHVTDPVSGARIATCAPIDGLLFRQELWRQCLRGQSLTHVAGPVPIRSGNLLSD